ncbi:MAG TPA: cupredoxin domain-containing protein [Roseiflexaceae bacterium]|nr:cupredoxin domain-containing protein [Roseiflexaceae bacterium]
MSTPMVAIRTHRLAARPTLRTITIAALLANTLLFGFEILSGGPDDIMVPHVIVSLVVAGIVALRFRWPPVLGALLFALQVLEGYIFLGSSLTQPDSTATFAFAALFFAISIIGLVAGVGATVQNYRAPRSRPFVDPLAPAWINPSLLVVAALALGGILSTAIQPRGVQPNFSPEALAGLPTLTAKEDMFDRPEISAKVGETVVLRLDNADTTTHYLDIDEFNVHALIPPGKSNVALFKPTQPGTYTFYCHPHADKAARAGMVGTLVVEQ